MSIPAPTEPSVISLPLPDPEAYPDEPREYAVALMQSKEQIEKAMDELRDVLASHGSDASTSLVDPEGYPRGDIDIYAIRHARAALARLTTDLRTVNNLLPNALANAFRTGPSSTSIPSSSTDHPQSSPDIPPETKTTANGHGPPIIRGGPDDMPSEWPSRGIAEVNTVAPCSPAAQAGLQPQDVIYSFSGVTADTGDIQAIGAVVQRSEGQTLTILVLRGTERIRLRLTPRTGWGGRGTLGCYIVPASS